MESIGDKILENSSGENILSESNIEIRNAESIQEVKNSAEENSVDTIKPSMEEKTVDPPSEKETSIDMPPETSETCFTVDNVNICEGEKDLKEESLEMSQSGNENSNTISSIQGVEESTSPDKDTESSMDTSKYLSGEVTNQNDPQDKFDPKVSVDEDNAVDTIFSEKDSDCITNESPSFHPLSKILNNEAQTTFKDVGHDLNGDSESCDNTAQRSDIASSQFKDEINNQYEKASLNSNIENEKDEKEKCSFKRQSNAISTDDEKSAALMMDEDTRMSGSNEDSHSSVPTQSSKKTRLEVFNPECTTSFTVDKVIEYLWPLDGLGEHYFLQEQISEYLGITSFKRRYPDLRRRCVDIQEKEYLKEMNFVSDIYCELGLTAIRSDDVLDILFTDFPKKFDELRKVLRERKNKLLMDEKEKDYQIFQLDKSKMQEYGKKAALNAAKWNASFNKERMDERRYSFDLQTFSVHGTYRSRRKHPQRSKMSSYPVAVLSGQYIDICRTYRYGDIRAMPIDTSYHGVKEEQEREQSVGSPAQDSDNESTQETNGLNTDTTADFPSQITQGSTTVEKELRCKVCNGDRSRNSDGNSEALVVCSSCRKPSHPTCVDLAFVIVEKLESYNWQCMDCKTCAECNEPDDEEKMIFCDMCDRGFHIFCLGLRRVPNGRWHCKVCSECFSCGSRNPAGNENVKNAEWQHEYRKERFKKDPKYVCTLCITCDRLWKKRQSCGVCIKVYRSIPEDGMVKCNGCPKYVHKNKCSVYMDGETHCTTCYKNRSKTSLNHTRIIAAAKKKMNEDDRNFRLK